MVFDGKKFAQEIIDKLPRKKAKLAIFLSPENLSGASYVKIKSDVAKRLGVEIVMNRIDGDEDGIIVQLPHPDSKNLISQIPPEKDVDGLREDSSYLPAAVLAVKKILNSKFEDPNKFKTLIIGSKGFIGRKLMQIYPNAIGMDKEDFDPSTLLRTDVIISATGIPGLITCDMVKEGVIIIDVGFPRGDVEEKACEKASFFTPVPGGVGPVTVACLFENLYVRHSKPQDIKPPGQRGTPGVDGQKSPSSN